MSVTSGERDLIKSIGFYRAEVCVILDLCKHLLRASRKYGEVKRTVTFAIVHGGYNLSRWKIEGDPLLQKLNKIDDATESALLSGLDVLVRQLPENCFDDEEFKNNFNSAAFDEAFSLSGFDRA